MSNLVDTVRDRVTYVYYRRNLDMHSDCVTHLGILSVKLYNAYSCTAHGGNSLVEPSRDIVSLDTCHKLICCIRVELVKRGSMIEVRGAMTRNLDCWVGNARSSALLLL